MKGKFAKETADYGTKTKALVPIWARSVSYQEKVKEQLSEVVVRKCCSK